MKRSRIGLIRHKLAKLCCQGNEIGGGGGFNTGRACWACGVKSNYIHWVWVHKEVLRGATGSTDLCRRCYKEFRQIHKANRVAEELMR